jgi:hypothetical protein
MVDRARHDEEQVREPVDVSNQDLVERRLERHHAPLRTPADRPRHVQHGAGRDATREDKMRERGEFGLEPIDQLLEALDVGVMKRRLRDTGSDLLGGIGEPGAKRKQIALNLHERVADIGIPGALGTAVQRGDSKPDEGVELVDFTIRVDARIAFRDAGAAKERCLTVVAGTRIDFHDVRDGLFII